MHRALYLAWAEVLHVVRDRATLAQTLLVPVLQLLVLGNAATFAIRHTPILVVDYDRTPASRALIQGFAGSEHFSVQGIVGSLDVANEALLRGDTTMVVAIPDGFEESIVRQGAADLGIQVNAEKGTAAAIVQAYAARVVSAYGASWSRDRGMPARGAPRIEVSTRSWYNPTLSYPQYMVAGIVVSLVTIIGTLLTAQNIAREKELGTLEQLNVTPITRAEFIAGKLLPFWVLGLVELTLGLVVSRYVFDMPVLGSLWLLYAVAGVYLVVALAIGLFISTLVETQQQAMFVTFFIMMIYLLMSGLFTPVDSMPRWVQVASAFTPVRHFVEISRAILIKGAGLTAIARPFAILGVYGAVAMGLAIRQYRKTGA
ncbi:MAG TPA: ABC transporter permease [Vicinamibacterales bacterium]|jgi:ABC-2 type transport system permease protein|nr:ABC transporter permease [Vicinamibacterales bacterium]